MSFSPVTADSISEEYRAELVRVQQTRTLSEEAGEFRTYLVQQGVVEEAVKVLLGLLDADEESRPENGRAFLKAYFDTKQLDPFIASRPTVDVDQLLELNEQLHAQHDQLESDVRELTAMWRQLQVDQWGPVTEQLSAAFPSPNAGPARGDLDVRALLTAATALANERAAAAGLQAPVIGGARPQPPPLAAAGTLVVCSVRTLQEWALEEFANAKPGSIGSFEAFVRTLMQSQQGDAAGSNGLPGSSAVPSVAAAEAEAAASRAVRLVMAAQAVQEAGKEGNEDGA